MMNTRLTLDCAVTSNKYGKRALKQMVVLNTWRNLLKDENNLPKNWLNATGVLVGRAYQGAIPDIPNELP
jgi:hypothetical protein